MDFEMVVIRDKRHAVIENVLELSSPQIPLLSVHNDGIPRSATTLESTEPFSTPPAPVTALPKQNSACLGAL